MPFYVLRFYDNAPLLVDALIEHEEDFRVLLTEVKGFRRWGLFRTETGGMSTTICDTAEACTETVTIAANWIGQNLADQNIAPPTVYVGEIILTFSANRPEARPFAFARIFSEPGPPGATERADEIREIVSAVPGYRSYGVMRTATGAVNLTVADDKASADEIAQRLHAWVQANWPDFSRPAPRVIEGQAVKRIIGQTVPAH
jgi:hypothetical protein